MSVLVHPCSSQAAGTEGGWGSTETFTQISGYFASEFVLNFLTPAASLVDQ